MDLKKQYLIFCTDETDLAYEPVRASWDVIIHFLVPLKQGNKQINAEVIL
jgi:hypothetical protein